MIECYYCVVKEQVNQEKRIILKDQN